MIQWSKPLWLLDHFAVPLKLRPTGLGSGIDKDRPDYSVYSGEWEVGRICETRGGPEKSALVLVDDRQPSDDALGPRGNSGRGEGAVSEVLGRLEGGACRALCKNGRLAEVEAADRGRRMNSPDRSRKGSQKIEMSASMTCGPRSTAGSVRLKPGSPCPASRWPALQARALS